MHFLLCYTLCLSSERLCSLEYGGEKRLRKNLKGLIWIHDLEHWQLCFMLKYSGIAMHFLLCYTVINIVKES